MKVVAVKTCYTSDNKRKRPGEKFSIKSIDDFSYIGMALLDKGQEKRFDEKEELEAYLKKSGAKKTSVKPEADKVEPEKAEAISSDSEVI